MALKKPTVATIVQSTEATEEIADEGINVAAESIQDIEPASFEDVKTEDDVSKVTVVKPDSDIAKKDGNIKMVKVRLKQNHTCRIGSNRYSFEKKKTYDVPLNVKLVLERANLLINL